MLWRVQWNHDTPNQSLKFKTLNVACGMCLKVHWNHETPPKTFPKLWDLGQTKAPVGNYTLCIERISRGFRLNQCLPTKRLFQVSHGFSLFFCRVPRNIKEISLRLKDFGLHPSMLVLPILNFEKFGSRPHHIWPLLQWESCKNIVSSWCDPSTSLKANAAKIWSVGVCFKKSTSHEESSPAGLPNA